MSNFDDWVEMQKDFDRRLHNLETARQPILGQGIIISDGRILIQDENGVNRLLLSADASKSSREGFDVLNTGNENLSFSTDFTPFNKGWVDVTTLNAGTPSSDTITFAPTDGTLISDIFTIGDRVRLTHANSQVNTGFIIEVTATTIRCRVNTTTTIPSATAITKFEYSKLPNPNGYYPIQQPDVASATGTLGSVTLNAGFYSVWESAGFVGIKCFFIVTVGGTATKIRIPLPFFVSGRTYVNIAAEDISIANITDGTWFKGYVTDVNGDGTLEFSYNNSTTFPASKQYGIYFVTSVNNS